MISEREDYNFWKASEEEQQAITFVVTTMNGVKSNSIYVILQNAGYEHLVKRKVEGMFDDHGHAEHISKASFSTLFLGNQWLEGQVINKMMHFFNLRVFCWNFCHPECEKKMFFFDTQRLAIAYLRKFTSKWIEWWHEFIPNDLNIFELDVLYIPGNLEQLHWFPIVVFVQQRIIKAFDTAYNPESRISHMRIVETVLQKHALAVLPEDKAAYFGKWKFEYAHDGPKQANSKDCGVYTIMIADYMMDDIPYTRIPNTSLDKYRMLIAYSILRNRVHYSLGDVSLEEFNELVQSKAFITRKYNRPSSDPPVVTTID